MSAGKRAGAAAARIDARQDAPPETTAAAPAGPQDVLAAAMAAGQPDAPPMGADALSELLGRLQADQAAAATRIAELEASEAEKILDESDEVLDAIGQDIIRAKRRTTRLEMVTERVTDLLNQAQHREAEDGRRARYEAAAAAAREIESWIAIDYAKHAAAIGDGLARLGEVGATIAAANADRPAGAPPLDLEAFRALPAVPDDVRHVPEIYYVDDAGTVLQPTQETPLGQNESGQYFIGRRPVTARERMRAERVPGRAAVAPRPLGVAVHLPGVAYGDTDFWPRRSKLWGPG